jgi:hypothetical protein
MIHAIRYTEELERVGFTSVQAKTAVNIWMELMDQNFATKSDFKEHFFVNRSEHLEMMKQNREDINNLKREVQSEIANLREEMRNEFIKIDQRFIKIETTLNALENKIIIKLSGVMVSLFVISGIILNYLSKH